MRKLIITGVGIVVLGVSFLLSNYFKNSKKEPKQKINKVEKTVFVENVENKEIPIVISANGNLTAKNKVDIYSEVQGILEKTSKDFRVGVSYNKGQTLLRVNSQEFYATIKAQRSLLQNLIASIMPDIRLDYADSFEEWNTYLKNFEIGKMLNPLPIPKTDKEKYFITGKNIYTTYYNIKNLEVRLTKYNLRAPFNGVLTETSVTDGTLVRSGQKIGEFIDVSVFELPLSVNASFADILRVGKKVTLKNLEETKTWEGKVSRVNSKIDQKSQTVQVFIQVKGESLREGMYLEATVPTQRINNAIEVNRKLLIGNKSVYVVKNKALELVPIKTVHFNEETVVIKGLDNDVQLVSKPVAGAYVGMPVKIFSESQNDKK